MAGFYLYSGNRQEQLMEKLAEIIRHPLPNPLEKEYIMVQHAGIKRWLSMQLSQLNGVVANTEFQFPNQTLNMAYQAVLPDFRVPGEKEDIQWNIFKLLKTLPDSEDFAILKTYRDANSDQNTFSIAGLLADLFDQYQVYRPEMIESWEDESEMHWQAQIWRMLPREIRENRKQQMLIAYRNKVDRKEAIDHSKLPVRLTVFGVSYITPYHLEVLKGLSQLIDIHFFFLNPCQYYWGDLISEPRIQKILYQRPGYSIDDLHLETGNPLLSSWGRYGQEFFRLLYEKELTDQPEEYVETPLDRGSLLNQIQTDILDLLDPTAEIEPPTGGLLDDSISLHSCHSRMREVEVLKDQMLKKLSDPNLNPSDIVVMTPEIEAYAPLIQAVFSTNPKDPHYIPYSIADRVILKESMVIRFFLDLLTVHKKRFTIAEVLSLFESAAIQKKFELSERDLDQVQSWLEKVNIRWGIDGAFRSSTGVPATFENTWRFGIDRILTGIAIPGDNHLLIEEKSDGSDILPFNDLEGSNALIFGHFLDYFEELTGLIQSSERQLNIPKTIKVWKQTLEDIFNRFFAQDPAWEEEFTILYEALEKLLQYEKQLDKDFTVDIDVIHSFLEKEFSSVSQKKGFMGYGITFCSMKPMRSIPFKVIAMLGMNDKSFPRIDHKVSFDLSGDAPRLGDRSSKQEDRYLFLETLISAREKLYISYTGQSVKDNSPLAPSTLVTELLRYLEQGYLNEAEMSQIIVKHPLQAFNPIYFSNKNQSLFSYSDKNRAAAEQLLKLEKQPHIFQKMTLPKPEESFFTVSIEELVRFFDTPVKSIYNKRLNVYLDEEGELAKENEPFSLNNLEKYIVQDEILKTLINKEDAAHTARLIKSKGVLPHALPGEICYENTAEQMHIFFNQIQDQISEEQLDPYFYDIQIGDFRLTGEIRSARQNGLFNMRPSGVKPKDRLRSWLEHLVINYQKPDHYPLNSILIGFNTKQSSCEIYQTEPIEEPRPYLESLMEIYKRGLCEPLPFFPSAADAYIKGCLKSKSSDETEIQEKGLSEARIKLDGNKKCYSEFKSNPYAVHYFKSSSTVLEMDFIDLTTAILQPAVEHQILLEEEK